MLLTKIPEDKSKGRKTYRRRKYRANIKQTFKSTLVAVGCFERRREIFPRKLC
jgi:hypothetical protein